MMRTRKDKAVGSEEKRTATTMYYNITLVYELLSQQVTQREPDEALRIDIEIVRVKLSLSNDYSDVTVIFLNSPPNLSVHNH